MENRQFYEFLTTTIKNGDKRRLEGGLDDSAEQRLHLLQIVKENYEWFALSASDKQSKRLLKLARERRAGKDVSMELEEVNLYSKIIEVMPYIKAVSHKINNEQKHLTEELLDFCETQLNIIDFSLYKRDITFPSKKEIEVAFKSYTERIKPDKIPVLISYDQPEVKQKIGELYDMFLRLAEISK
ncbi:hypothetical protein AB9P05_24280 [Roseivirga sp. BDSF3-8]|uniref:hypothetical protein n=1 Tax=Roseivirga sp. BDSF3-8 TaxID=3241598 RepID=UPI003531CD77